MRRGINPPPVVENDARCQQETTGTGSKRWDAGHHFEAIATG
ncbi:hypothetical protein [Laspinema palackyanum]